MNSSFDFSFIRRIIFVSMFAMLSSISFVFLPSPSTAAAQSVLTFRAEALWKGFYHEGEWVVIDVYIFNPDAAFDAEINVNAPLGYDQRHTDFKRPVTVPAHSNSHFRIYVCLIQQARELSATLIGESGQILGQSSVPVVAVDYGNYMVAAIGNTVPIAVPGVGVTPVVHSSQKRVVTVPLTPDLLPDRPEGLTAFDAIVLHDTVINQINHDQYNALLNWTLSGGRLILAPPDVDNWLKLVNLFGSQIIPATLVNDQKDVKLNAQTAVIDPLQPDKADPLKPGNGSLKIIGLEAKPQSRIISDLQLDAKQSQPLVIANQAGNGWIVASATDPFEPVTAASNLFWSGLVNGLAPVSTYDPSNDNILIDPALERSFLNVAVTETQGGPFNFIFWGGLAAYMLLVIPLNYLGLRKSKRPEWAILTVPLSAIAVSAGLIFLGNSKQFVGVERFNVVQFNDLNSEANAWVSSMMVVHSNMEGTCELSFENEQPLLRPAVVNASASAAVQEADNKGFIRSPLQVNQDSSSTSCDTTSEGQVKFLSFEDWQNLRRPVDGKLQLANQILAGKLTNNSNYLLQNAVLVMGENYQSLGQWNPQQQLDINFYLNNQPGNFPNTSTSVADFLRNNPQTSIPEGLYYGALGQLTHDGRFGSASQTRTAYIIGWVRNLLTANVKVNKNLSNNEDYTLVVQPVEFDLAAKSQTPPTFQMPPELFMPQLLQNDAQTIQNGDWLNVDGTQMRQYYLPSQTPPNLQVQALSIDLDSFYLSSLGAQNVSSVPEISIYNWRSKDWRVLAPEDLQTQKIYSVILPDELEPQTRAFRIKLISIKRGHLIQKFNISLDLK